MAISKDSALFLVQTDNTEIQMEHARIVMLIVRPAQDPMHGIAYHA